MAVAGARLIRAGDKVRFKTSVEHRNNFTINATLMKKTFTVKKIEYNQGMLWIDSGSYGGWFIERFALVEADLVNLKEAVCNKIKLMRERTAYV